MRVFGHYTTSLVVIVPVWLLVAAIAMITIAPTTTSAFSLAGRDTTTTATNNHTRSTCRNSKEQEQCRVKCEEEALQPLCIDQECICASIGDGNCSADKNKACVVFCKELDQKFTGCNKDECICDNHPHQKKKN